MMKRSESTTKKSSFNPPNSTENDTYDSGILDFGTSVSVNDDLRRSIGIEIQEIEANSNKLKDNLNSESNLQQDLVNNHAHANKELAGLNQGASDIVDTLSMNMQILHGLKATMMHDTVWGRDTKCSESDGKRGTNDTSDFLKNQILKNSAAMTELQSILSSKLKSLQDLRAKCKDATISIERSSKNIKNVLKVEVDELQTQNAKTQAEINVEQHIIEEIREEICKVNLSIEQLSAELELKVSKS
jgi:hypothetical protein